MLDSMSDNKPDKNSSSSDPLQIKSNEKWNNELNRVRQKNRVFKENYSESLEEKIKDSVNKNELDENEQENEFNAKIHKLIMAHLDPNSKDKAKESKTIKENKIIDESTINAVLPAIRLQYIRAWKRVINSKDNADFEKKSEQMNILINRFDSILQEKQKRDQKKDLFTKLFTFFIRETLAL